MKLRLRIAIMAFGMMLGATFASAADVPPPLPGDEPGSAALPAPVAEVVKAPAPVAHKPIEKRELPAAKHGHKGAAKVAGHAHKVADTHRNRNSHPAAAKAPKAAKSGKSARIAAKPAAAAHAKTGSGKPKKHR